MLQHIRTLGIVQVDETVWKRLSREEKVEIEKICDSICVLDGGHTICNTSLKNALFSGERKLTLEQFYSGLFEE